MATISVFSLVLWVGTKLIKHQEYKSRKVCLPQYRPSKFAIFFLLVEVLAELHRAQESAYNLRDTARQDYLARAKICSKIVKYPNIEDYAVCTILLIVIRATEAMSVTDCVERT